MTMTSTQPIEDPPSIAEELLALRTRLDDLDRRIADLGRRVAGRPPRESAATGTATPAPPAEAGWMPLSRRIDRLAHLLARYERRAAGIAGRVDGHDEVLRMMCIALERLDDPYGMGASLDERIGLDGWGDEPDGEGDAP